LRGFVIVVFLRITAKSVRTTSIAQSPFPGNLALRGCACYLAKRSRRVARALISSLEAVPGDVGDEAGVDRGKPLWQNC